MNTSFIDSNIAHSFWPTVAEARRRAIREAVDTGGIILDVRTIELEKTRLFIVGTVPSDALQAQSPEGEGRVVIRARGLGLFHTSWGSLLFPGDTIGFLILRRPVVVTGTNPRTDFERIRVAMEVKRRSASIASGCIGPVCCTDCNESIPTERLKAIPGIKRCANCQKTKEEMNKWKQKM